MKGENNHGYEVTIQVSPRRLELCVRGALRARRDREREWAAAECGARRTSTASADAPGRGRYPSGTVRGASRRLGSTDDGVSKLACGAECGRRARARGGAGSTCDESENKLFFQIVWAMELIQPVDAYRMTRRAIAVRFSLRSARALELLSRHGLTGALPRSGECHVLHAQRGLVRGGRRSDDVRFRRRAALSSTDAPSST